MSKQSYGVIASPVLKVLSMWKTLGIPKFPILIQQLNTSLRLSLVLSILGGDLEEMKF